MDTMKIETRKLDVAHVMILDGVDNSTLRMLQGVLQHKKGGKTVCLMNTNNLDVVRDYCKDSHLRYKYMMNTTYNYPLGTWKCDNSPYEVCVYDHENDPAHDFCLICGEPDERK